LLSEVCSPGIVVAERARIAVENTAEKRHELVRSDAFAEHPVIITRTRAAQEDNSTWASSEDPTATVFASGSIDKPRF